MENFVWQLSIQCQFCVGSYKLCVWLVLEKSQNFPFIHPGTLAKAGMACSCVMGCFKPGRYNQNLKLCMKQIYLQRNTI